MLLIAEASLVAEQRLKGVWTSAVVARELQSTGSVVVADEFSYSEACEILLGQESNPIPCISRQILNQ